ncbi:MAG: metal-dependent phosphohydrolase, partial [Syntrophus sp. (in: bacteria)]|nr:metal-dependent phosphohydrolase [Syntrophus sp. (in: bacteria)]
MGDSSSERTEKDLLDSPWLQRLRRIGQLQSARWVYPAAEHSRFQHSLGTMHVAGEFGKTLYPSLREVCPEAPSANYVEALLRLGGLLHDVGHGPYG